jgi:hypothetical protein
MSCTTTCRKPNGNQAHCGACHETFSAVSTFDRHRTGSTHERRCAHPEAVGLRLNTHGVWTGEGRPAFWDTRAQPSDGTQTAAEPSLVGRDANGASEGAQTSTGGDA